MTLDSTASNRTDSAQVPHQTPELFAGGGEMGTRMRALDWSQTPLGPVKSWPQSLRIAVRILLGSAYPTLICWGPEYTMLYNDAYRSILGTNHPGAVGRSFAEVFAKAWQSIGPLLDKVTLAEGTGTLPDQSFLLDRNGYLEECYFTFSFSPIPGDDGGVGGVFVTALETTERGARPRTEAQMERRRLQELLEQAPAAMGLFEGPEHRWVYVNESYVRVTGRKSASDFLGKTLRESLPELEGQGFVEALDRVYATGEPYLGQETKVELNRGEGGSRQDAYFDFAYQPIRSAEGEIQGILVQAVDVTHRVTARRLIEINEERLRLAQAAGQIGTWEWDPEHGRPTLSADLHRIFATQPDDPDRTRKWAERVEPADREKVEQIMQDALRTGEMDFEYRYRHPSQGLRWLHCKGRRLEEGAPLFGVVLDITDRKRAEEILRQREEEYRSLADGMPQLVFMAHSDGAALWYNQRWYEYTGATEEQLAGHGWKSVVEPALMIEVLERWNLSLATGEPFEMTFPLRGADGVYRPFLTRAVPIRNAAGDLIRWFGTNTDIGAEVAVREELEKSRGRLSTALVASRRLAAIVESSDDAIISKDLQGIVTSWNRRAEQMFGFTAEEIVGQSILKIIPPELHNEEKRILETIALGERIEHFETVRRRKDGESIEVSLTISPVRDETGRIVAISKIARDITQRKRAERALQTTEKLASVGRLAATIAHEINNPLEAVTNLVYLARQNAVEENVRLYLADAEEELARISLLTRQTLGFYREMRGIGDVRLGQLIEPLISVFGSRTRNKGIQIATEIRQDPLIHGIPGEIRQLVANLLNNSIDAVATGGRIRIRVSAATERNGTRRDGVRLTIADSGAGIPVEIRERLFEPFFTTKREVGTGLGLWVCRSIVEKHGGDIRLRSSTEPGKSFTAFSVFLPLEPVPTVVEPEVRPAA